MQERLYVDSPRLVRPSSAIGCAPIAKRLAADMPANCSAASIASALTSQIDKALRVTANPRHWLYRATQSQQALRPYLKKPEIVY
jgi:hypothetical protein